jgi:hypothetical protein
MFHIHLETWKRCSASVRWCAVKQDRKRIMQSVNI